MRIELTQGSCTLIREPGDKALSHESTVGYHMRRLLNAQGHKFVRTNPSRHGLTACRVGMIDHKADVAIWHERYQIENAAHEFNCVGRVTFQRVDEVTW